MNENFKFKSNDKFVSVKVSNSMFRAPNVGTSGNVDSVAGRALTAHTSSFAKSVTLAIKPTVLAQEQRQERLNQTIRKGYAPISRSTKG